MERETANKMLNHIIDYVKIIRDNYIRATEQGCDIFANDFREKAQQCTVLYNLHSVYPFIHEDKIADEADRLNSYLELTEDEYILNKGNFGENDIKSPTIPKRQEIAYSSLLGLIGTEASLAVSNLLATIMRLAYKKRKEAIQIADTICQPMQTEERPADNSFKKYILSTDKEAVLKKLHDLIGNERGKEATKVLAAAIRKGLLIMPTSYNAIKKEFNIHRGSWYLYKCKFSFEELTSLMAEFDEFVRQD